MLRRNWIIGASTIAGMLGSTAALALPQNWEMNFQPAATPVMERIEDFHHLLLVIITLISLFVLALLIWIMIRYNKRANPVPSKVTHHTLLEVIWTAVPVIILVLIAIPSFRLLYFEGVHAAGRPQDQGDRQAMVLDLRIPPERRLPVRFAGTVR